MDVGLTDLPDQEQLTRLGEISFARVVIEATPERPGFIALKPVAAPDSEPGAE